MPVPVARNYTLKAQENLETFHPTLEKNLLLGHYRRTAGPDPLDPVGVDAPDPSPGRATCSAPGLSKRPFFQFI